VQIVCDGLFDVLWKATAGPGLDQDTNPSFSRTSWLMEPYELIVHNKDEIQRLRSSLNDGDAKQHLDWFLEFLESHQPGAWDKYDEVHSGSCQRVLFEHLWLLYPPRTTVFKVNDEVWRAYVVERCEIVADARTSLRIFAWSLDFNTEGDRLIPYGTTFEVPSFSSERSIRMLELIPEWFILPTKSLREELIKRGKEHWEYRRKPHHKEYTGGAWPRKSQQVWIFHELMAHS
jgi:hypothetical protein